MTIFFQFEVFGFLQQNWQAQPLIDSFDDSLYFQAQFMSTATCSLDLVGNSFVEKTMKLKVLELFRDSVMIKFKHRASHIIRI